LVVNIYSVKLALFLHVYRLTNYPQMYFGFLLVSVIRCAT
jgi:hypothetical protein